MFRSGPRRIAWGPPTPSFSNLLIQSSSHPQSHLIKRLGPRRITPHIFRLDHRLLFAGLLLLTGRLVGQSISKVGAHRPISVRSAALHARKGRRRWHLTKTSDLTTLPQRATWVVFSLLNLTVHRGAFQLETPNPMPIPGQTPPFCVSTFQSPGLCATPLSAMPP